MKDRLIIAIDGPAGSGKSTVARQVARRMGILYVDTGAMYRAITLKALRSHTSLRDEKALSELVAETNIDLKIDGDFGLSVYLDGEDVTEEIRRQYVTNNVKHLACLPAVRERMVVLQRHASRSGRAVLEGRDIGTVVFPDADFKVFLDASEEERVNRRYKELRLKGYDVNRDEIKRDVDSRDTSDKTREVAPLKKAVDAVYIDTTGLTIEEVTDKIIKGLESLKR
ncbi:MAG: (d)CMP kinase [Candidatus Omnitrophica bacterium]|nr:(d)CMP kinase [Candidatus Omnitrophota bacterium]